MERRTRRLGWLFLVAFASFVIVTAGDAAEKTAVPKAGTGGPHGKLQVDITDILGNDLPGRVELLPPGALKKEGGPKPVVIEAPKGRLSADVPVGEYTAYVYVYFQGVPVLVDAPSVSIKAGASTLLPVSLLEGASGNLSLLDFDKDCDFAIDRVELACKTDPANAASVPGYATLEQDLRVLSDKEGWYRGELHAHSSYGCGKESVKQLIARAENAGLDFLAITDRNTMAACADPDFKSKSLVLIPALEWGSDKRGVALIYAPGTFPAFVDSVPRAQALVDTVQAQGGFFAIAHPCFPTAPWQWGLGFVNGIEVWCRDWNTVPPMSLKPLNKELQARAGGKLVHSIAYAAATGDLSANGQATVFYDVELIRGLMAAAIGGSGTASPDVPIGRPVTYVYAKDKSLAGILDGMRRGRTYVSAGPDGPRLRFVADVLEDNKVDVSLGGIIPLNTPVKLEAWVEGAKGAEIQILLNGYPLLSKKVESDAFAVRIDHKPTSYSVYRARVTTKAAQLGFGPVEVLAMTSPIYAKDIQLAHPRVRAYQRERGEEARTPAPEIALPDSSQGEIQPKWQF